MICILYFCDNGWFFFGLIVNRILFKIDDLKNLIDIKKVFKKKELRW